MGTVAEDLGEFLRDVQTAVGGVEKVVRGAPEALGRVDQAAGHLLRPETLERVAHGAIAGATGVIAAELATAGAAPPAESKGQKEQSVLCRRHGTHPWRGTICCRNCRRVFQTADKMRPLYAPEFCPCTVRLMPAPLPEGQTSDPASYSAMKMCAECFLVGVRNGGVFPQGGT